MQYVLADLINSIDLSPAECIGWMECGKKKKYKGIEIWEIPRNTILYKGINKDSRSQNIKYYTDPFYVPGQISKLGVITDVYPDEREATLSDYDKNILTSKVDQELDFIYLAGNLSTAAVYASKKDGRIISFITTSKIRLLNFSNIDTLRYIYEKGDKYLKKLLKHAFAIDTESEFISHGRRSFLSFDYEMVNAIKQSFVWVDGYAYEPRLKFHEEIAIFRPSIVLKRYPVEYRPTGIQITNSNSYKPTKNDISIEIWVKVTAGYDIEPVLIPVHSGEFVTRKYQQYERRDDDYRDNFITNPLLSKKYLLHFLRRSKEYQDLTKDKKFQLIDNYIYDNDDDDGDDV